ncbi:mechanosensitive ion channel family protein [Diaphorobacter sp.]|uniref:mechanosensitive ion channel family protein n=1 Tax=Diaphorobacter sp. TaxID=1934310 RepID=UPI003D0C5F6F
MTDLPLPDSLALWMQASIGLAALLLLAFAAQAVTRYVLRHAMPRLRNRVDSRLTRVLWHDEVLRRAAQVVPPLIVHTSIHAVPHLHPTAATVIDNVAVALTVLQAVRTLIALLDAAQQEHGKSPGDSHTATRSIKSYVQLGKLVLTLVGAVIIVATLIDRSPLILLSGLGAMSAVLMLVFKDTILSFTAGLQLSSNDMLRVGDWIEMPQVGADGDVVDIALHTVKVQNWDKTITTIPTWRLMSESYRNWRGMSEAGGRRIKRTVRLDAASVRFLSDDDIDRLSRIALLAPYLEEKRQAVHAANAALGERACAPANLRRLTNIGTFRAYVQAYLRANPCLRQDMTLMVRTLEPTAEGVPLELYCFTATTAWVQYEAIQGDIFDHLLAVLPEFDLRLYQSPTGYDIRAGLRQGLQ